MNYIKSNKNEILVISTFLLLPWIFCYNPMSMIMGDNWRAAYPAYQLTIQKIFSGSSLLWNEYVLAGHPFLAEIVNGVLYPPKLFLYLILPVKWAYTTTILLHFSLVGWFTYLYLRCIHITIFTAFFGGLILMLSPIYRIQILDSISLLHTITWFPFIMYLMEKRITSGKKKFLLFAACIFVIQILAGFTQDSFYTALAIGLYTGFRYYQKHQNINGNLKYFSYDMIFFGLIVFSFAAIQLLPTLELLSFARHYQLSWNLIEQFSAPPLGFLTFINPFLWGGFQDNVGVQSFYYLPNFTSNNYLGIVTFLFAIYAFKFWKNNSFIKIWSILLILSLAIASGVHIMPIAKFLFNFPLTHAFRFHTRIYFISSMAMVVLFAFGLDQIRQLNNKSMRQEINKILKLGFFVELLVFCFVCGLIIGIDFFKGIASSIKYSNYEDLIQYYQFCNIALFKPFVLFVGIAILLGLLPFVRKKSFIIAVLLLLTTIELLEISSGFITYPEIQTPYINAVLKVKSILKPTERMILINKSGVQDASSMINKIEGLNGFVSFDERVISSFSSDVSSLADISSLPVFLKQIRHHNGFLSMLGLKYFIIADSDTNEIEKPYQSNAHQWQLLSKINSQEMEKNEPRGLKILSKKVLIEPNTYYKINLKLNREVTGWLYVDLYGENYNNPEQHLAFAGENFISKKRAFQGVLHSGNNLPLDIDLRIVTNDVGLDVKDVEIYLSPEATTTSPYKKISSIDGYTIYENPNAKPRIYSTEDVRWINDISYDDIDLNTTAVLNIRLKDRTNLGTATIQNLIYQSGNIKARLNCPADKCLIILSESYFPGWRVSVDNKRHSLHKINDLIMGTFVNKGDHWIQFYYLPKTIILGIGLFVFGLIWVPIWMLWPQIKSSFSSSTLKSKKKTNQK